MRGENKRSGGMPERMSQARVARCVHADTVSSRRPSRYNIFKELLWLILLKRINDCAVAVSDQELASISRMHRHGDQSDSALDWIFLFPKVGESERPSEAVSIKVIRYDVSILHSNKGPVKHRICHHRGHSSANDLCRYSIPRIEIPKAELIVRIEANEPVCAELDRLEGGSSRRIKGLLHALLAKDVDPPGAELALGCSDSEQRLYRVVRKATIYRVLEISSSIPPVTLVSSLMSRLPRL
jgi:hypothetical protein